MKLFNKTIQGHAISTVAWLGMLGAATVHSATLYVGHGIPGEDAETALGLPAGTLDPALPVDVMVNGGCLLTGFTLGEFAGPLSLAEGTYTVSVHPANTAAPCSGTAVIGPADIPVASDANATILAHLTENGDLGANLFPNDIGMTGSATDGRVQLHHAAAAPTVDVTLRPANPPQHPVPFRGNPKLTVSDVANGDFAAAELTGGFWKVDFAPAGSKHPVYTGKLSVDAGSTNQAYAVGSLANGTFEVITNNLRLRRN